MPKKNYYFSIVIPVHARGDEGLLYFTELLDSINSQYFKNFEVIVSDSSGTDSYKNILLKYKFSKTHLRSTALNSSSNLNLAIKNATGDFIKVMFSDDLIISDLMLSYLFIVTKLFKKKWILLSSYDFKKYKSNSKKIDIVRGRKPRWNNKLLIGENTISSPSVLLFKNGLEMYFDERVRLLMDTEFYWRFKSLHGLPYFSSKFYIANREHKGQDQNFIDDKTKIKEQNYVMKIHKYKEIN